MLLKTFQNTIYQIMKTIFSCSVFFMLCAIDGKCQKPFQVLSNDQYLTRIDTFNTTVKDIFNTYYLDCIRQHYFHEGLGVVEVVTYKDSLNRNVYMLTAILDDRYLDTPTDTYFSMGDMLFLLYKGNSYGLKIKKTISEAAITELKTMLEGRTYIRPPKREKWQEFYDGSGHKMRRKSGKIISYGNPWNTVMYIFDSAHEYHTLIPL